MKLIKIAICLILLLSFISTPAYSQIKKVAQTGLQFLRIETGARRTGDSGKSRYVDRNRLFGYTHSQRRRGRNRPHVPLDQI